MASRVEIMNLALRSLGAVSIASPDGKNSENARKMEACYEMYLRSLLRSHPWSFNKREIALSQLTEVPVLGDYTYIYSLPADFVRLNKTSVEPDFSHKIKGKKLYSNSNSISIEYGYYVTDPTQLDDAFVEAFSAKLAAELCYSVTRDQNLTKLKWQEFQGKYNTARNTNSMEISLDEIQQSEWLNSRV